MNQLLPSKRMTPAAASMDAAALADHSAASAFLNALLREWDGWSALGTDETARLEAAFPDGFAASGGEILKLPLAGGDALLIHAPARTPSAPPCACPSA
ncbi:hypothetical protein V6L77_12425 [Pannonibacter sp. Pt2-lr]